MKLTIVILVLLSIAADISCKVAKQDGELLPLGKPQSVLDKYPRVYKKFNQGYKHPSGQAIYGLDPAPYYGNEANRVEPHEIDNETGVLQFHNSALLKGTTYDKYLGIPTPGSQEEPHNPINHKDPSPYYDPIQDPANVYKKRQPNLFAVPIQYKEDLFVDERIKKLEEMKRLIRKTGPRAPYYDPTHILERPDRDPLKLAIAEAVELRKEQPPQQLDDFLKKEQQQAEQWKPALNHKQEPYYGGEFIKKWHKKNNNETNKPSIEKRHSSHKYTVKENSPHPYYDGSVDARTPAAAKRLRRLLRKLRK